MSIEAMRHYEAALKEAFPSGATGDVFFHWNEARKAIEQTEQAQPVAWSEPTPDFYITELSRNTIKYHNAVHGKQEFSKNKLNECVVPVWFAPPPRQPEQAQPENMVLVPRNPTPEQIKAGDRAAWPYPCSQIYRAMLEAATPPRQPLPKGEWPKHPSKYVDGVYMGYSTSDLDAYAMQVLAAHGIKE